MKVLSIGERELASKEQKKFIDHFKLSAYDLEKIVNGYRTRTVSEFHDLKLLNDNQSILIQMLKA